MYFSTALLLAWRWYFSDYWFFVPVSQTVEVTCFTFQHLNRSLKEFFFESIFDSKSIASSSMRSFFQLILWVFVLSSGASNWMRISAVSMIILLWPDLRSNVGYLSQGVADMRVVPRMTGLNVEVKLSMYLNWRQKFNSIVVGEFV